MWFKRLAKVNFNFLFIFLITLIVALTLAVTVFAGVFFYNYFTLTPDKILQSINQTQLSVCKKHQALKTDVAVQSVPVIVPEISACDEVLSNANNSEVDSHNPNLEEKSSINEPTSAADYSLKYVNSYTKLLSDTMVSTEFLKESLKIYKTYEAEIANIPDYVKVPNLRIANYLNIFKNNLNQLDSEINKFDDQSADDVIPIKSNKNKIALTNTKLLRDIRFWTDLIYKNLTDDNTATTSQLESETFGALISGIEKVECENKKQEALKNQETIISDLRPEIIRSARTQSVNDLAPTNFYSFNFNEFYDDPNVGDIRFIWKPSTESELPDKAVYKVYYRKGDCDGVTEIDAITEPGVVQLEYSATSDGSPRLLSKIASYSNSESELLADGFEENIWYTFVVEVNSEADVPIGLSLPWTHYIHDGINIKIMEPKKENEEEHGALVETVMIGNFNSGENNQKILPIISDISLLDRKHLKEVFFEIDTSQTEFEIIDTTFDDSSLADADIINMSFGVYQYNSAVADYENMKQAFGDDLIPLLITAGGNGHVACTDKIYNDAMNDPESSITSDYKNPDFQACDLLPAYIVKNDLKLAENLIIVGDRSGTGSKPGPFLKDYWITTYFTWSIPEIASFWYDNKIITGTSFSAPYVTKIIAEIMNRAPSYTNKQIKDLIFSTAIDAGESGVDEVYGHGILNPHAIFGELTKRGYYGKNLILSAPCI